MEVNSTLANFDNTNPSGFASFRVLSVKFLNGMGSNDVVVRYRQRYPRSGMEFGPVNEVYRKLTKHGSFRLDGWRVIVKRDYSGTGPDTGYEPTLTAHTLSPMSPKSCYNERPELDGVAYDNESGERLIYSNREHRYMRESESTAIASAVQSVSGSFTSVSGDPLASLPQVENANSGDGTGTTDADVGASPASSGAGGQPSGGSSSGGMGLTSQIIEGIANDDLGYDQSPGRWENGSEGSGSPNGSADSQWPGESPTDGEGGSGSSSDGNDDESWAIPYVDQQNEGGRDPDEEFDAAEGGKQDPEEEQEVRHEEYETIKACMWAGIPVYLSGPAGSGKNYTVEQICRDMDWDFYFSNSIQQEYKITGFIDAGGTYHETEFYKACTSERECAFFIDEMDNSIPEVLVLLNAAIANGYFEFPTGRVDIKNVHFVAAGNTTGSGADDLYTGRMVLDQASLDRFAQIQFNYSMKIEMKLSHGNKDLVAFIHALRDFAEERGIRATFSYRCIDMVTRLEVQELPMIDILKVAVFKGLDADTVGTFREAVMGSGYSRYTRAATIICDEPAKYFSSGRY